MPSPFPGMDPHLESSRHWHPLHTRLVVGLEDLIAEVLPPRYYTSVEERTYLIVRDDPEAVQLPDVLAVGRGTRPSSSVAVADPLDGVEVYISSPDVLRQRYLEIRDLEEGERVVAAVEILSPSNKRPDPGRDDYLTKRPRVFDSQTNLVEIDLLRAGPRLEARDAPADYDYGILISRASTRPRAQLIPFGPRDPIPSFPLPLAPGEPEPVIALGVALRRIYDSRRYGGRIDYHDHPDPPLRPADEAWSNALLQERGLR